MKDDLKKQIPLRISEKTYNELYAWAESEFRSINGQIEYLLSECIKVHKKRGKSVPKTFDNEDKKSK